MKDFALSDLIDHGICVGDLYAFNWADWTYDVYTECVKVKEGSKIHTYLLLRL